MEIMENCNEDKPSPSPLKAELNNKLEEDSGLENTSESEESYDEEGKCPFSSMDSLEGDLQVPTSSTTVCPFRTSKHIKDSIKLDSETCLESVAILDIETNNNDEQDVDLDNLPIFYQNLWLGKMEPVDYEQDIMKKPTWLNEEKLKQGQQFARDHLFCINYAEMVSLYLIFALRSALQPLIFTGKSHTPFKAFQRYLSTLTRLLSWYNGDLVSENCPSRRQIDIVRKMHKNVYNKLTSATVEELRNRVSCGNEETTCIWSTSRQILLEDFQSSCPVPTPGGCPFMSSGIWVNQFDMSITQFAFVGLAVTYPREFGIHQANDDDLDAFLHLWRYLGHLLGIKDRYNFCNGSLDEIRQRTNEFIQLAIKPSLRDVSTDWEHMSRCLTEGIAFYVPGVNFDVSLRHVCEILGIHTPRLTKSFTFWQSFMYRVVTFTFRYLFKIPGMLTFNNNLLYRSIRLAQNASKEVLANWENKEFPFMKQSDKMPINIV